MSSREAIVTKSRDSKQKPKRKEQAYLYTALTSRNKSPVTYAHCSLPHTWWFLTFSSKYPQQFSARQNSSTKYQIQASCFYLVYTLGSHCPYLDFWKLDSGCFLRFYSSFQRANKPTVTACITLLVPATTTLLRPPLSDHLSKQLDLIKHLCCTKRHSPKTRHINFKTPKLQLATQC